MGRATLFENVMSICVIGLFASTASAQTGACASDAATIVITFPESDSPTLPSNDVRFTQAIFTSGVEPFSMIIYSDPLDTTNQLKFPDYFTHQWNSVTSKYTVRMIKGINRDGNTSATVDDVNTLQYNVSCTESQGSATVVYKILKIQITDVNDNSPYFINAPYTVWVNELTPVGLNVFRGILADDLDDGPNKQITYILTSGYSQYNFNGTQYFYLPSDQEGILAVLSSLDFEPMYRQTGDISQTFYNITVIARDNAVPASTQRSISTTIKVIITDGDDQGPEFVYPSCIQSSQPYSKSCVRPKYLTTISSDNASEVNLQFRADPSDVSDPNKSVDILMQDRDTLNSTVTCNIRRITPAGYESYFTVRSSLYQGKQYRCEIVKVSGKIINRTDVSQLEIVVEAVEQSASLRVDYATIILTIEGTGNYQNTNATVNLYPPTITTNGNTDVPSTSVFNVTVRPGTPFNVTQDGNIVLNKAVLDYEEVTRYQMTLMITELTPQKYSAVKNITINILNVNDNSPVILNPEKYSLTLEAGMCDKSRNLVTVQSTDADFGPPQFRLSRVVPANAKPKFSVSPGGTVSVTGLLTPGDMFAVYVTASDQGNPVRSAETVVLVRVTQSSKPYH
ncbi:hypothetical protein Btru_025376 [Bulinus truncatus]|nr:hypothetical protein Btru_025376 [Bulinus truncatus]